MLLREDLLIDFCRSIDSLNDEAFKQFKKLVLRILKDEFGTIHSDIKLDGRRADKAPALDTMRLDEKSSNTSTTSILKDGKYTSQRAFSYHLGCPLWINTKCGTEITGADKANIEISCWGDFSAEEFKAVSKEVPAYQDFDAEGGGAKTSVVIPLRYGSNRPRVIGVLCLEFKDRIELNKFATVRVSKIARAIAKAIWLNETTREQVRGTEYALIALDDKLSHLPPGPGLTIPTAFFAYSGRADDDVVQVVKEVAEKFKEKIRLDDWASHHDPGSISRKVSKSIRNASFGICYFSEPCEDGSEYPYRDNPNVLIEAGMMSANFPSETVTGSRWMLIRESDDGDPKMTGPPPFDIADQRFLVVPRKRKKLDKTSLKEALTRMLGEMTELQA